MAIELQDIVELTGLQLGLGEVRENHNLKQDLGADSTDLLNLLTALEDKFGLFIDETQAARVETVEDLYRLVLRQSEMTEQSAGGKGRE